MVCPLYDIFCAVVCPLSVYFSALWSVLSLLPCVVVCTVTDVSLWGSVLGMGLVVTFYTTLVSVL